MKKFFLLHITFYILHFTSFSQQYNFRTYSLEEGIAQSQILSLCKDSRGNIWFGTYGSGISIFNGIDFKNLTIKDGIVNNNIRVLFEDSKANIWIGTDGGLSIHNGYDIKNYTVGAGISSSKIQSIVEDKKGNVWVGTKTGGVNIFKEGSFEILLSDDGLLNNNIKALFEDNSGRIWASCFGQGIAVFNGKEVSYLTTANGLLDDEVNCFHQEKNGTLWIGSEKGITTISDVSNIEKIKPEYKMTGNPVTSFFTDEHDNLWIGTFGGGILKYDGKIFLNISQSNGLSNNHIYQIISDNSGGIWIGTDGGGACNYKGDAFISYTQKDGLCGNMVMAIQEDLLGNIWVGTEGNGLSKFNKSNFMNDFGKLGFNGKYIRAIMEDNAGNLWISAHYEGLYKYDGGKFTRYSAKDGFFLKEILCLFQDKKDNIWIGGTGGVYVFSGGVFSSFGKDAGLHKDKVYSIIDDINGNLWFATEHGLVKKMQNKTITYSEKDGIPSNFITTLIRGKNDILWIGTENGICSYDGFKFQNYTVKDGLTSGNIYSLIFDDDGNLISGTEKGFDKIIFSEDKNIQRVINYSAADGFSGIECNGNAICKDKQGNIWFGTVKGLTKYNPKQEISYSFQPQTNITDLSLFFEKTDWNNYADSLSRWYNLPMKLHLPYDKNHLTFQFSVSSVLNAEKALFQFMLEGFDKTWSPLSHKREATYSNLHAGKYVFKVKAISGETETTPAEFSFSVSPPFWETWWFYFLGISVFLSAGYVILHLRTRTLEKTKILLEEMVQARTEEILHQKEELENLSIVASETVQGVLIANGEGKVEWMNDGLQRMTGFSFEEIKSVFGTSLHEISSHPDIRRILRQVQETRKSLQYDSMHRTKDGREQWVTATVTPVFENSHRLKKIVVIYTDITERKKIEEEISQKNKDITESILYAKQIQEAVLPQREKLFKAKPDSFILYLPKDIVSGDFYWFTTRGNTFFIAAADCTGHGVPGALMSMIGNEFLYQITFQLDMHEPHLILEELDRKIKQSLRQAGNEKDAKDGMDIALCAIDMETNLLKYAGAYRPVILIRNNGDFIEYEAEKYSIGGFMKLEKDFKTHSIQLQKGDSIYLFTDGYLDQFGGRYEKKFFMKGFKDLLLQIYRLPMSEQDKIIEKAFQQWKGKRTQTDDVLVMGMRV